MQPDIEHLFHVIRSARLPIAAFSYGMTAFLPNQKIPPAGSHFVYPTWEHPNFTIDANGKIQGDGFYKLPLDPSLEFVHNDQYMVFDYLNTFLMGAVLQVGDAFAEYRYLSKSPELEFLRHSRNAVAHGNRIHITAPLKRKASFKQYVLSDNLHGRTFLGTPMKEGLVLSGDILAMLDFLENYLQSMPNKLFKPTR